MNWLCRLLGLHACGPFTPWVAKSTRYQVTHNEVAGVRIPMSEPLVYTRTWQERSCVCCGKVFQEDLEHRSMTARCIACDRALDTEPACPPRTDVPRDDVIEVVYHGLRFRATGNYGSGIYDPRPGEEGHLEVIICDACVMAKAESHAIRHAVVDGRRVVREDVPYRAWRGTVDGAEWLAAHREPDATEPMSRPYGSVAEMIRDSCDPAFADEFDEMIREKRARGENPIS